MQNYSFRDQILKLINEYQGPKLALVCVGGGALLNDIIKYPGASRIIEAIQVPYSVEAMQKYLFTAGISLDKSVKSVSKEMLDAIVAASSYHYPNSTLVCFTGALVTIRYRKGLNWGLVSISNHPHLENEYRYSFEFPKLNEIEHSNATIEEILDQRNAAENEIFNAVVSDLLTLSKQNNA